MQDSSMRRCAGLILLLTTCLTCLGQPSYWFQQWQRKPDAKTAQEYFMVPGANMTFTYATNRVILNAAGGAGLIQLTGDVLAGPGASPLATALKNTGTAGTYTKVTFDAKGRETSGTSAVLASADYATQGGVNQVLHGGGAGNPSWLAVDLANDVTGDLGVTHLAGGVGAGATTFWCGNASWATPDASYVTNGWPWTNLTTLYAQDTAKAVTNGWPWTNLTTLYAEDTAKAVTNGWPWTNLTTLYAQDTAKAVTNGYPWTNLTTLYAQDTAKAVTNGYPWTNVPIGPGALPTTALTNLWQASAASIYLTNNLSIISNRMALYVGTNILGMSGSNTFQIDSANVTNSMAVNTNGTVSLYGTTVTVTNSKVGINTNTPGAPVHISCNSSANGTGVIVQYTGGKFVFLNAGTTSTGFAFDNSTYFGIYGATSISDGLTSPRIYIKTWGGGDVGVGTHTYQTADPGYRFSVQTNRFTVTDAGNVTAAGTMSATNGYLQQVKTSFATNFTNTAYSYLCANGTNQVITLPDAATMAGRVFRIGVTNGWAKIIITNATGTQTIRDGSSLSFTQVGIGNPTFLSDGAHWWPASKTKVVMPNAQFSCSTNIPLTVAGQAYPVTFNSVDFNNSQGIALLAGTNGSASAIWITNSGEYTFQPSIVEAFNGNHTIRFWFRSNSTNIPNSGTPRKGLNNSTVVITVPFDVNVTQPTMFEIWAMSDGVGDLLQAEAGGGVAPNDYPAGPAVICPVYRISDPWP